MTVRHRKTGLLRSLRYRLTTPLHTVRGTIEAYAWRREYRTALAEARASARPGPFPVVLVLDRLKPHANAGKLVRTADAMGANSVHTVAMTYFNIATAVESIFNIPIREHASIAACFGELRRAGYTLFALEPALDISRHTYLDEQALPERSALIVGHESHGVSFTAEDHPDVVWLSIRQFGVVPCMNASVAGSIALYEYARQHGPR